MTAPDDDAAVRAERTATARHTSVHRLAAPREVAAQRDDGPLVRVASHPRLPVPEVALLLAAVIVAVAVPALGAPGPGWAWVLGGWVLALASTSARVLPRLAWPAPGLLRAFEYGALIVLLGGSGATYALLATLAFHHYDIVYRLRLGGPAPPAWLATITGGWSLRVPALAVATAAGIGVPVAAGLAGLLGAVLVAESVHAWTRHR